ncbi:thiolase family protein [Halorussus vallis]|uniref:thiolase family protein n=2 Tax=Halorussus TaxID=1070314 RepID=UPI0020A03273|nr:thiolase family protein [Halorussus vallis]USZ74302.1 thiolase family protein [Halorussus vallis]
MTDALIVDAARTPHGSFLGALADVSAVELGATAVRGLVERTEVDEDDVDWLALGNAVQAGVGQVPARQVGLAADLPDDLPATTVNEASGSGLRAIALAVDRIVAGRADVAVAGGTESMSNAPYLAPDTRRGKRLGDATLVDALIRDSLWDMQYDAHMGELTEDLAERFEISREAQDEYALASHERAVEAVEDGLFEDEVIPVEAVDGEAVERDEGPRADTSVEALADLPTPFREDGTITPGNASDLSDGAGCALLADAEVAESEGLEPLARVEDYAVAYRDPKWFGMSVGDAVERLLDDNDLSVADVDVFELNEAFAAQMVYVRDRLEIPMEKHNPRGGAVALGHPIGASGGILTATLAHAMADDDDELGVVGMSIGGGGGIAMLLRRGTE